MSDTYFSAGELKQMGFKKVGNNVFVSRDARLFAIEGELGDSVRIDVFAVLTGKIFLGKNVHISPFCFLGGTGGEIRMQDGSGMSTHVSIFTKSDDYSAMSAPGKKSTGNVLVGENTILGAGTKILPGITIGKNTKISSGCVIDRDIESDALIIHRGLSLVPFHSA
jgi:acetyltransferase-like isoleucine patch superfamily enzyme